MPNPMERVVSKAMGKTKAVKARIKGLTGIFQQLSEEHGEVSALLHRVSRSPKSEVWAELFPTIRRELLAHERGELSELYAVLRQHEETRAIADEHDREASELESLLNSLNAQRVDSPEWKSNFERLVGVVKHHTGKEENEYFPKAQNVIGQQAAKDLKQRYMTKKQTVMQQIS